MSDKPDDELLRADVPPASLDLVAAIAAQTRGTAQTTGRFAGRPAMASDRSQVMYAASAITGIVLGMLLPGGSPSSLAVQVYLLGSYGGW